jgi:hypothetical protein
MVAPSGTRTGDGSANGSAGGACPPGAREARDICEHADRIGTLLARLARIQVARSKVRAQRYAFLALGGLALGLVGAVAVLGGTFLFARGLAVGLSEAFGGRAWLGELASGPLLVGGTMLGLVVLRAVCGRRALAKLGEVDGPDAES